MTVVFCIDDNPRYVALLLVAIRSLKALHPHVRCVCVYSGSNPQTIDTVRTEGAELALYQNPVLNRSVIPPAYHYAIGAYLKLELALVPELANESRVLYCDTDVLFLRDLAPLWDMNIQYVGMAREASAPFFPEVQEVDYEWRGRRYTVPLPFPIWTFSSGVALFNLAKLRAHDHIHNFLSFCAQTTARIGNLDQSLLNYFFGRRITKLDPCWNRPPYHADCLATAHVVHFHGPKPWDRSRRWRDLCINDYHAASDRWFSWLTPDEARLVNSWKAASQQ